MKMHDSQCRTSALNPWVTGIAIFWLSLPVLAGVDLGPASHPVNQWITADDVILRSEASRSPGTEIRRLYQNRMVTVLTRSEVIEEIDGKKHAWVQVSVEQDGTKDVGWILDKYIGPLRSDILQWEKQGDCSRAPWLRAELATILKKSCDQISDVDLARVDNITIRNKMIRSKLVTSDLKGLTGLKTLIVEGCALNGTLPKDYFDSVPNLEVLSLAFNYLTKENLFAKSSDDLTSILAKEEENESRLLDQNRNLRLLNLGNNVSLSSRQTVVAIKSLMLKKGIRPGESAKHFVSRRIDELKRFAENGLSIQKTRDRVFNYDGEVLSVSEERRLMHKAELRLVPSRSDHAILIEAKIHGGRGECPPADYVLSMIFILDKISLNVIKFFKSESQLFGNDRFLLIYEEGSPLSRLPSVYDLKTDRKIDLELDIPDSRSDLKISETKKGSEDSVLILASGDYRPSRKQIRCKAKQFPRGTLDMTVKIQCSPSSGWQEATCKTSVKEFPQIHTFQCLDEDEEPVDC